MSTQLELLARAVSPRLSSNQSPIAGFLPPYFEWQQLLSETQKIVPMVVPFDIFVRMAR